MNTQPPYRKWAGVLLGLLLHGSAHFLSGRRAAGIRWFLGLAFLSYGSFLVLALPGPVSYGMAVLPGLACIVLWGIMLKQSCRPVPRIGVMGWVVVLALSAGLRWTGKTVVRTVVETYRVPSTTMAPTIEPGDFLVAEKLSYRFREPGRGDIVVFRTDGLPFLPPHTVAIKRIAGLPGERIRIEPPHLVVNGRPVTDPPIFARIASGVPPFNGYRLGAAIPDARLVRPDDELVLGEDEYLVLGDHTLSSLDGRYWGAVPRSNLVARATRIYWPLSRTRQSLGTE